MNRQQQQKLPESAEKFLAKFKKDHGWNDNKEIIFKSLTPRRAEHSIGTRGQIVADENGDTVDLVYRNGRGRIVFSRQNKGEIVLIKGNGSPEEMLRFLLLSGECASFKDEPWHIPSEGGYKYQFVDVIQEAKGYQDKMMAVGKAYSFIHSKNGQDLLDVAQAFKFSLDLNKSMAKRLERYKHLAEDSIKTILMEYASDKPEVFLQDAEEVSVRSLLAKMEEQGHLGYDKNERKIWWGDSRYKLCDYAAGDLVLWRAEAVKYCLHDGKKQYTSLLTAYTGSELPVMDQGKKETAVSSNSRGRGRK